MQIFDNLNPVQCECVKHTEGAVLVLAGAGSGKTRVLTHRIANIINNGKAEPYSVLAITFTNKAAGEMQSRLQSMGLSTADMWVCTIHSMCNRMLRMFIDRIGYSKSFTIYDDGDKERVIKRVLADIKGESDAELVKKVKYHISNAKNAFLTPHHYANEGYDATDFETIIKVYERYEQELKKSNALDFDDLIVKTYELLRADSETSDYFQNKFKYIHIDEFQDTNIGQYQLISHLAAKHGNIFAVGDDDQSIYGWRGAEVENIFRFQKDFKDAKVFKLEQNYRSTKKIIEFANCIIKNNSRRMEKELFTENTDGVRVDRYIASDENDEAYYVSSLIRSLREYNGYEYRDIAVLVRLNAMSRAFEQEFLKYNIPYRVFGGFKFFERKEIKDIIAYLRLIVNPFDEESILRVINFPKRKIGDTAIAQLRDAAADSGMTLYDAILSCDTLNGITKTLASRVAVFRDIIKQLVIQSQLKEKEEFITELLNITGIKDAYSQDTEDNYNKLLNIDEFINAFSEFFKENPGSEIDDYLTSVTLISDIDQSSDEDNSVTIATVHAVKGLEFKTVFISGLDDGIFPISRAHSSPEELEEERRLMYVAITRAMHRLYVTRAKSRFLYGSRKYTVESTFLKELSHFFEKPAQSFAEQQRQQESLSGSYSTGAAANSIPRYNRGAGASYADRNSAKSDIGKTDSTKFKTGDTIIHKTFGEGTIITISGSGRQTEAAIAFPKIGVKTFNLSFAPIEHKA